MCAEIVRLSAAANREPLLRQIREIFFHTTSRQTFNDDQEREDFFTLWTSYYLEQLPEETLLVLNSKGVVCAYLTGCADSARVKDQLSLPGVALFADLFARYPAHFHINVRPDFQGQGNGQRLIEAYLSDLQSRGVPGVHIVTAPEATNTVFYRKMGFRDEVRRDLGSASLLFMGRAIF